MHLKAQKRTNFGKANKYLRRDSLIPAVVFGKGMDSESILLNYNDFSKVYKQSGETDLIDIDLDDKKFKVLIKDIQFDPITDKISHVGFYKPDLTVKIEAQVPVSVSGEDKNSVIKNGLGIALQLLQEITVEALPEDLPHEFKVDVSLLANFGDGISISSLDYDKTKVSIPYNEPDEMVVRLDEIKVEEEPEQVVSEEEAIANLEATKEKAEEGEEEGEKPEEKHQEKKEDKS